MEDFTTWGKQTRIKAGDGEIVANIHYREDPGGIVSWVVMLHGLGGNRHEHNGIFTRTAAALANNGYGAIRFDFRGNGESDFTSEFMTLESMKEDINNVVDYVSKISESSNVYLLGLSLGGLMAAVTLAESESIKGAILWEPPFALIPTLKRLLGPLQFDRIRVRGYIQSGLLKLSKDFVDQFDKLDVSKLPNLGLRPVLLVQGESDPIVTMDDAKLWCDLFANSTKFESFFVKEADHAFSQENHALDVIAESVLWLNKI